MARSQMSLQLMQCIFCVDDVYHTTHIHITCIQCAHIPFTHPSIHSLFLVIACSLLSLEKSVALSSYGCCMLLMHDVNCLSLSFSFSYFHPLHTYIHIVSISLRILTSPSPPLPNGCLLILLYNRWKRERDSPTSYLFCTILYTSSQTKREGERNSCG